MASLKSLAKDTAIYGLSSIIGRSSTICLCHSTRLPSVQPVVVMVSSPTCMPIRLDSRHPDLRYGDHLLPLCQQGGRRCSQSIYHSLEHGGLHLLALRGLGIHLLASIEQCHGICRPSGIRLDMFVTVAIDAFQCIPFAYLRYQKRPLKFAALKMLFIIGNMAMNIAYFGFMGGSDVEYAFYINIICTSTMTIFFYKELKEGFSGPYASLG